LSDISDPIASYLMAIVHNWLFYHFLCWKRITFFTHIRS